MGAALSDRSRRDGADRYARHDSRRRRSLSPTGRRQCRECAPRPRPGARHHLAQHDRRGRLPRLRRLEVLYDNRAAARFHVALYDQTTGALVALIEADQLGRLRTGATTGVAPALDARPPERTSWACSAWVQAERNWPRPPRFCRCGGLSSTAAPKSDARCSPKKCRPGSAWR